MDKSKYWQPGDPLTEQDKIILEPLIRKASALGYTPSQSDMQDVSKIKLRFRTWGNAVKAAGLPWVNYADQQKLRADAKGKAGHQKVKKEAAKQSEKKSDQGELEKAEGKKK
jgi:hypothetical protein